MEKFRVAGIPGFDGDYPIDIGSFTMRELHIIKEVSGVRAGELEEAFSAGDTDVVLAVAVIAVRRNGGDHQRFQLLAWESDLAALEFITDDETADPQTPTQQPASGSDEATPDGSGSVSSLRSDGDDHPETNPDPTGDPLSAIGVG